MDEHIKKMDDHDSRLRILEKNGVRTNEQLNTINDKLDRILDAEEIRDRQYVRKDVNELEITQIKKDMNDLGKNERLLEKDLKDHKDQHTSKVEKYIQYILMGLFSALILGRLTKII